MSAFTPYTTRTVESLPAASMGGWTVKRYQITAYGQSPDSAAIEAAAKAAEGALSGVEGGHDIAFQIVHFGEHAIWAPVFWWIRGDNLAGQTFRAEHGGADFKTAAPEVIGCVWELALMEFERRAWIEAVLTDGDDDSEKLADYLGRRYAGAV